MNKQKGLPVSQVGLVPILIIILIALAVGGYLIYQKQFKPTPVSQPLPSPIASPIASSSAETDNPDSIGANWKTYTNSQFGYSFKYPSDYKSYPNLGSHVFYSPDTKFDKTYGGKTQGLEIGSVVYGPNEDIQNYIGPNTKADAILASKLVLPSGYSAKAYVNIEDITVTIDYRKDNKNMRIMVWCGGENGNSNGCEGVLSLLLSTFKFTN